MVNAEPQEIITNDNLNAKVVVPTGAELVNIIGEMAGVVPVGRKNQ